MAPTSASSNGSGGGISIGKTAVCGQQRDSKNTINLESNNHRQQQAAAAVETATAWSRYRFQQQAATASEAASASETAQEAVTVTTGKARQQSTGMMQCININHVVF